MSKGRGRRRGGGKEVREKQSLFLGSSLFPSSLFINSPHFYNFYFLILSFIHCISCSPSFITLLFFLFHNSHLFSLSPSSSIFILSFFSFSFSLLLHLYLFILSLSQSSSLFFFYHSLFHHPSPRFIPFHHPLIFFSMLIFSLTILLSCLFHRILPSSLT